MDQCQEVERLQARAAQSQHRLQLLGAQERALQVQCAVHCAALLCRLQQQVQYNLSLVHYRIAPLCRTRREGRLFLHTPAGQLREELGRQQEQLEDKQQGLKGNQERLRREVRQCEADLAEVESGDSSSSLAVAVQRLLQTQPSLARRATWVARITPSCPLLQEGPQCGLVVLAMAACSMSSSTTVTEVVAMARARGVTKKGEMFSVHYMAGLARELIPGCSVSVQPVSRLLDTDWLVARLLAGCLLLVPYDCSANHSPGLLGGLAAHWCLVTGCLLPCPSPPPAASPLPGCPGFHFQPSPPGGQMDSLPRLVEEEDLLVVARQPKSCQLAVWPRASLAASCANLRSLAEKRRDGTYVIPEGGIEAGLCGQFVLLQ